MIWKQLHDQIFNVGTDGFTAISTPLEDIFLHDLPDSYFRVWHFLWRDTFGRQEIKRGTSIRHIAEQARVQKNKASRALHFFDFLKLISYQPGDHCLSHVTIMPVGLPDAKRRQELAELIWCLTLVEQIEGRLQRKDNKFFFTNAQVIMQVKRLQASKDTPATCEAIFKERAGRASQKTGFTTKPVSG